MGKGRAAGHILCSWRTHQAEGPAGGLAAAPAQAVTVSEDVRLNKGRKPGSSSKFPACPRPTAKTPIVAVRGDPAKHLMQSWDILVT